MSYACASIQQILPVTSEDGGVAFGDSRGLDAAGLGIVDCRGRDSALRGKFAQFQFTDEPHCLEFGHRFFICGRRAATFLNSKQDNLISI